MNIPVTVRIQVLWGAGEKLSMPLLRHTASVASGVEELRVRDRSGAYRVFYSAR